MKKSVIKKDQNKKLSDKKTENGSKAKRKTKRPAIEESPKPRLPVSDSNSGYIPFGG